MAKLQFKFREATPPRKRAKVFSLLRSRGASDVHPLFPDETDAELASLFVAELPDGRGIDSLLRYLNREPTVEFAEPEVDRRLIRARR